MKGGVYDQDILYRYIIQIDEILKEQIKGERIQLSFKEALWTTLEVQQEILFMPGPQCARAGLASS